MEMEKQIQILNIDDILPNRFQPRIKFNEQAINELAESIKLHGVIQPIVVRKISDKYEIIAGERRYKASILAGKTTIPAIITSLDDKNSAEVALIENVQRQDLTPIEEAISYKKILDMGYISQEALGEKLGKKQSTIANKLRLLNLNDEVQEALMENKISERHARSLLKLNNDQQILMLNRIMNERMTVRKTDEEIEKLLNNTSSDNSTSDNEAKEITKGEMTMNDDTIKEFNIPTEPIIENNQPSFVFEDEEPEQKTNIPQQPVENYNSDVNPGFMDIDKIEKEATDIVKEPAEPADINELLKPTEQPVDIMSQVEQQPEQKEEETVPVTGGKFFNMFGINNSETNPNYVEDIEDKQVNMDFGEPISNPSNIFGTDSLFAQPSVKEAPKNEQINDSFNSFQQQPVENYNNQVTDDSTPEESIYPTPKPIAVENNVVSNNNDGFDSNLVDFSKPVEPLNLTDEDSFTNMNASEKVMDNFSVNKNVKFDENGDIEVPIPQTNQRFVTADMKTVINTIRDCAATIEKYGFKIETEEIDLEDSYEVTFKIDKNV